MNNVVRDYKIAANEGPPTRATPAAMRWLNAGVNAVSAAAPEFGRTVSTTFTLYPGTYYWFNGHLRTSAVTARFMHPLTVFGAVAPRTFPHVDATVKMISVTEGCAGPRLPRCRTTAAFSCTTAPTRCTCSSCSR